MGVGFMKEDQSGVTVQGFAPVEIVTGTTIDTTDVLAIRLAAPSDYQINGAGTTATMPVGVTVIADGVESIDFSASTTVEVMR